VVELLSENSPVLIVKNEKQDRIREINERQLRGQFTNLKETLETNLATNRGLEAILDNIRHYISHLLHIGATLPKTWVNVRTALERDKRNYISLDEYFRICEQHGFKERQDQLQLSGYLHDLGVCLHFQDDPLLRKTVILKPEWGTAAVYKILDNPTVQRNLGKFTKADLTKIWCEEQYADMCDELLQLMMKFQLCYLTPNPSPKGEGSSPLPFGEGAGGGVYIAPQLLTENQPEYEWNAGQNLRLRYSYEFMPKGILTRFIWRPTH
jgi:internalin A